MKTLFISSLIIICATISCDAQKKITAGNVSINGTPFKIEQSSRSFFVTNINSHKKFKSYLRVDDIHADVSITFKSLLKVFNVNRLRQLLPEGFIGLTFSFDHTGKVYSIQYFMNTNTSITMDEIATLDKTLKSDVTFIIPSTITQDNLVPYTQVVRFKTLLEKAQIN